MTVFETFWEQDGPQDAKAGDDGEKFRMSERQRVRGTAVDSCFCESRGNLVSNTFMPPFILFINHFAPFACFGVRPAPLRFIIHPREARKSLQAATLRGFWFNQ
ncbi:MAG: hypothetical protein EOM42_14125 [Negativicutes bacterium]|nr:hypothetical protein [Negativicutes bacterium]